MIKPPASDGSPGLIPVRMDHGTVVWRLLKGEGLMRKQAACCKARSGAWSSRLRGS
ncbi:hypothetical protein BRAS3809_2690012 [Bradyrhizobium sp. STM 3809]|nr:hypothetical protein BRAS3809_2690012 [Bradyrhizobium sp. STM 3809]